MSGSVPIIQKLCEDNLQMITVSVLPALLMVSNSWLKSWLGLPWKTYGADTAFCGVAALTGALMRSSVLTVTSMRVGLVILVLHAFFWTGVLKLASKQRPLFHVLQAITGGLLFASAATFALYYLHL